MNIPKLSLTILPDSFAICKLAAREDIPSWAFCGSFSSVTRTPEELSIVCPQNLVPPEVESTKGWKSLKIEARLDFEMVGIVSSITSSMAEAGISIFAISTFNTDYFFIKEEDLGPGVAALRKAGHQVR
jgi:hypothetical protein